MNFGHLNKDNQTLYMKFLIVRVLKQSCLGSLLRNSRRNETLFMIHLVEDEQLL